MVARNDLPNKQIFFVARSETRPLVTKKKKTIMIAKTTLNAPLSRHRSISLMSYYQGLIRSHSHPTLLDNSNFLANELLIP